MRISTLILLLLAAGTAHAQIPFEKVKSVQAIKVIIRASNPAMITMASESEPNQLYLGTDLPDELRKDGLHLTIDGDIGAIPPNVRMIGTPFHITLIKVTGPEKRKFRLSKRKWVIK